MLLVDDDELILRATVAALRHHEVVATTSPVEAVDRIRRGERFDVVFCDAVMPELGGLDVFAAITAVAPELARHFVLLSGGLDAPTAAAAGDLGLPVLEKPFDLDDLEARIERSRTPPVGSSERSRR